MAEENKIKTCEEYVLNELRKKEVELATTQKELQEVKGDLELEGSMHEKLFRLVADVCAGGRIEVASDGLISVYLLSGFVGCYFETNDNIGKEDRSLKALRQLIDMFDGTVEREE